MRRILQFVGTVVFWCAWPALWVYHKRDHGRTRVVLVQGDNILVLKQWIGLGKWGLPGGGLHKNEDVAEGAIRELAQETGITLNPAQLTPIGTNIFNRFGLKYDYHIFAAKVTAAKTRRQKIEISYLEWLSSSQLNSDNSLPDTLIALQMVRTHSALLK